MNVILRTFGRFLLALAVLALGGWAAVALLVAGSDAGLVRRALACGLAALACAAAAAWIVHRARLATSVAFGAALAATLLWYHTLHASNGRTWPEEVARTPWAEIEGDRITIHEVRHFAWQTEADFTPRWETRTVALSDLEGVDLVASYWMGDAIAHVMVSFVFANAPPVLVSIEARKDRTRPYGTLPGFFRQFELVYVVGDERDVIRLRTNYRKDPPEDVYLYRVTSPIENGRRIFLDYMRAINEVREHPVFYNTVTTNCTTMILAHAAVNSGSVPYSWKILLSGYAPEYIYEAGRLDGALPFEELKRRSHINAAAQAADQALDFSQRIRAGLPARVSP